MIAHKKLSQSKKNILDIAAELFAIHGYDGVSMRMIANNANMTKAALYYHFQSKSDLLMGIVSESSTEFIEKIQADFADTSLSPREKIYNAASYMLTFSYEHRSMMYILHDVSAKDKKVMQMMNTLRQHVFHLWQPIIKDYIEQHELPHNPDILTGCFLTLLTKYKMPGQACGHRTVEYDREEILNHIMILFPKQ